MQLIVFTSLYPNSVNPQHGIFIRRRLLEIQKLADLKLRLQVIAPVPWAPPGLAPYQHYARIPAQEVLDGITVHHPRYLVIPKIGMHLSPLSMAWASAQLVRTMLQQDRHSLLDAHYFYPDGVAAARLAQRFKLPLVISARGSDINLIANNYPWARRRIQAAAQQASANIAVAEPLALAMQALGMPRLYTLRNGVDTSLFYPCEQVLAKTELGLPAQVPVLCCVGNLVANKGQQHVLAALKQLPTHHLLLAGTGTQKNQLLQQAHTLGVAERVHFLGSVPAERLRLVYSASDAMVLASAREGWPNVVLEALACGCPVIANEVGAVAQMLTHPKFGQLIHAPEEIAKAVLHLQADRAACRAQALNFAWEPIAQAQWSLYQDLFARHS
ncbi:MAG: hypothetical protein RLZZ502_612 [Pseudomonadota bacterium]|jgi:glycosyltransferase involved in cell wall biosynthesis